MRTLNEKEVMTVLLNEHKLSASSLTNLVIESSNQNLRNDATNILTGTLEHQKQIFDIMAQKGWYQVQNASTQDIGRAQQELNSMTSGAQ